MNLTDVRAHENCDGDASRIATVAELSARFAHELNEPLMCVLANAHAAERWLTATPPHLEEANASIRRILRDARAVNETMQHIRALFNRESFDKKEASIPAMVGEAVRLVQEDPNKREVPIDLYVAEHLPKACVDPIQIRRVFVNLISNAIEAMEDSRIPLVKVRAAITDQDEMLIQVIDNGPGVDDTEKIFDAFVTTREKGLGIGLTVSRSIIEAHDGQLWAENNPDGGATFSVALPLSSASRNPVGDQVPTLTPPSFVRVEKPTAKRRVHWGRNIQPRTRLL
jgi:C4-dicarboxylate-specific signal transduction histidine kinase